MQVGYSSDEEDYNFRARPRSRDHSLSESALPAQKAKKRTKDLSRNANQASEEGRSFVSEHKSHLVLAALLAGGAAAATFVLKRTFGKKQSTQEDTPGDAHVATAPDGRKQAESKKLAMRRKRSEYVLPRALPQLAMTVHRACRSQACSRINDQHCTLHPASKAHKAYLQAPP